jgi:putative transposase
MSERKPYPTDLTDEQWDIIAPLLPKKTRGRPPIHARREMINALLYIVRTGCAWRMLPHDLPPWEAVYAFWRSLIAGGVWVRINDALRIQVRLAEGREADPSLLIIDSQSVQTAEKRGPAALTRTNDVKGVSAK